MPDSHIQSSVEPDLSPQTQQGSGDSEEDIQSVVGVSISRTQTRLRSPTTPAVERAASLHYDGQLGFLICHPSVAQAYGADPNSLYGRLPDETPLPSPWTSEPKLFEKHSPQTQRQPERDSQHRASTGPMGMLSDLNFKRFLSTFAMPTLPKSPSLRDISIPTWTSWTGLKATPSQIHSTEAREKTANTEDMQKSQWLPPGSLSPNLQVVLPATGNRLSSGGIRPHCIGAGLDRTRASGRPAISQATSEYSSPQLHLKRSISDQSLALHRANSLSSSLGDDTRWENVHKRVNSRAKALADSFQDSHIRLPSLSNMNLSSLRPDFLRNRAASDTVRLPQSNRWAGSFPMVNHGVSLQTQHGNAPAIAQPQKIAVDLDEPKTPKLSVKPGHPHFTQALESLTGDIVIMGGYRGSILRSAQPPYRQLWVPVKVGLNIRKVDLEVGLEPEDEEKMEDTIFSSGMLSHIGPVDMGRRLLKRLRSCRNAQEGKLRVHDYGYDWRLSPHLLSRRLIHFLESLHQGTGCHPGGAIVVAHSLGGLITRHAVNQRPDLFAGVVYAGVPQYCINILGPLRHGDEVLLSSKVLTAQVNFTLRTSYLLLPEDGQCFIDKRTKENYPVNFFDVDEWKLYAFSPCIAPTSPPVALPERKGLLSSVTDNLMSLPLVGRKDPNTNPKITSKTRIGTYRNPIVARVDPQPDNQSSNDSSFTPQTSTIPPGQAEEYLARTLARIVCFKDELRFDEQHAQQNRYPPLSVLYGTSVPTVFRARVACRAAIKCKDAYDDLIFASGDGVCLARAAMLPAGYECVEGGKVRTERGHVGLLGDLEGVGKCLVSVIDGRRKGIGLGLKDHQHDELGKDGEVYT
ncbi:MAG: hypothetical protein L6R40_001574 [Gallowayella cf. fulva]|nr:MAG: hypothetical protein L6R40_001574 [Xanthomendoza cf. fulva]